MLRFKSLLLLCLLSVSAIAFADGETKTITRTVQDTSNEYSFSVSKDIYVTNTYYQTVCGDVPVTTYETQYQTQWVPNNVYVCDPPQSDGTPGNCNWVDQGSYQSVPVQVAVTHYENQCWQEPYTQEDYDHTWTLPVHVKYPDTPKLLPGDEDTVVFEIAGRESKPSITFDQSNAVFHYNTVSSKFINGTVEVELSAAPYLKAADVGPKTIGATSIKFGDKDSTITIIDGFSRKRVTSTYTISVALAGTHQVLGSSNQVVVSGKSVSTVLPIALDETKDYNVTVNVTRTGPVLIGDPISFSLTKLVKAEALDMKALANAGEVESFSVVGVKDLTVLRFRDQTADYVTVQSSYHIELSMIDTTKKKVLVASGDFARSALTKDKDGHILVSIQRDLKLDGAILATLTKGKDLYFKLTTTRTSKRFKDIKFDRNFSLEVTK